MILTITAYELAFLAAIPALVLAFHGVPLRLLAGAACSLLIPALVIGTVHVPPENQLNKSRPRCASRPVGRGTSERLTAS